MKSLMLTSMKNEPVRKPFTDVSNLASAMPILVIQALRCLFQAPQYPPSGGPSEQFYYSRCLRCSSKMVLPSVKSQPNSQHCINWQEDHRYACSDNQLFFI